MGTDPGDLNVAFAMCSVAQELEAQLGHIHADGPSFVLQEQLEDVKVRFVRSRISLALICDPYLSMQVMTWVIDLELVCCAALAQMHSCCMS